VMGGEARHGGRGSSGGVGNWFDPQKIHTKSFKRTFFCAKRLSDNKATDWGNKSGKTANYSFCSRERRKNSRSGQGCTKGGSIQDRRTARVRKTKRLKGTGEDRGREHRWGVLDQASFLCRFLQSRGCKGEGRKTDIGGRLRKLLYREHGWQGREG